MIKCCQHYESKCAGQYTNGTLAARYTMSLSCDASSSPVMAQCWCRYLFDLSREVQDLVGLLRDRALERERRIKQLEVRTFRKTYQLCFVGD